MHPPSRHNYYCDNPDALETALAGQLERHRLLSGVSRLGLAVSGGADSVALLHLLAPLCAAQGRSVTVLHLDHGLRQESNADRQFVQALAEQAGLPFYSRRVELGSRPPDGRSLEMAAREARLTFFRECAAERSLDAIATGHHADDVAETLLLRLARGSGSSGLAGLRPRSGLTRSSVHLIRPLLMIAGTALREWLTRRNLTWREDSSNSDPAIPRNLLRQTVLPYLEATWRQGLRAQLCRTAESLREDDALLEKLAAQKLDRLAPASQKEPVLPTTGLLRQPIALQRRILRLWLFRHDLPAATGLETVLALLDACESAANTCIQLTGSVRAQYQNGQLALITGPTSGPPEPIEIPFRGTRRWGDLEITTCPCRGIDSVAEGIGVYPAVCTLSAETLHLVPVQIRSRQPGDRIAPTGLNGSKKIQDLLVDAKVPENERDAIPVFSCGNDVVWIPGYRIARDFAVPSPDAPSVRISVRRVTAERG